MSGAMVIPVHYESSEEELTALFAQMNGLLFPGGNDILNGTRYYNASAFLFRKAMEANNKGDYFPVWGTCLGFEFMNIVVAGNIDVLTHFDAENISLPVHFTSYADSSRLLNFQSEEDRIAMMEWLGNNDVTENYHHYGISVDLFNENSLLSDFYFNIGSSTDRNGLDFVTAIEAKQYPFYALQFHPERSLFEWSPTENIDHSANTVASSQYFSYLILFLFYTIFAVDFLSMKLEKISTSLKALINK